MRDGFFRVRCFFAFPVCFSFGVTGVVFGGVGDGADRYLGAVRALAEDMGTLFDAVESCDREVRILATA